MEDMAQMAPETHAPPDHDGHVREHLANERTLLSWIRLGLSSATFGFVVARFGLYLRELAAHEVRPAPGHGAEIIGVGLVLLGMLSVAAGTLRYFRTEREIAGRSYAPQYGLIKLVVAVSLLVGLALVAYLVFSSQ
jgi:putative membrane protein